tara:strand:+ start:12507 stop:12881 length:375 start_codon:yes stop_codon:yes gene_type:complete
MKMVLLGFILICSFGLTAQIKKKDLGRYTGTIESYKINIGQELLTVEDCPIEITLNKDNLVLKIGSKKYTVAYRIKKLERRSYIITIGMPYSDLEESFSLNGKNKEMLRKGLFPQPDCTLKKVL